jgi:hypothetical protein
MSSFFGTSSIYSLPEDNYWSSGVVAYRQNSLSNDEPFLVELPKSSRPLLHITPLVGKRNHRAAMRNYEFTSLSKSIRFYS